MKTIPTPEPIIIGRKYVWEPDIPDAREEFEVSAIGIATDGDILIQGTCPDGEGNWVDYDRFVEAVFGLSMYGELKKV